MYHVTYSIDDVRYLIVNSCFPTPQRIPTAGFRGTFCSNRRSQQVRLHGEVLPGPGWHTSGVWFAMARAAFSLPQKVIRCHQTKPWTMRGDGVMWLNFKIFQASSIDTHRCQGSSESLQDSLIVNLMKPFNVRVVLNSKLCPAGEV